MAFKYSCFISYRHGPVPGVQKIYESFWEELAVQVGMYLPLRVYLDRDRLRGGDFFNRELASALCNSVCMISLFNPYYFDVTHTYPAREYQAMVSLERQRLASMPASARAKGLIIPIVMRGTLPEEITKERQFYELNLMTPRDLKKDESREVLGKIAEDIYHRHEEFRQAGWDPCRYCDGFDFPRDSEIKDWLEGITAPPPRLPWR